ASRAGNQQVQRGNVIGGLPADRDLAIDQRKPLALKRPADNPQPRGIVRNRPLLDPLAHYAMSIPAWLKNRASVPNINVRSHRFCLGPGARFAAETSPTQMQGRCYPLIFSDSQILEI